MIIMMSLEAGLMPRPFHNLIVGGSLLAYNLSGHRFFVPGMVPGVVSSCEGSFKAN